MPPPDPHPAALPPAALLADCDETRTRRSGPGGQHRNKVETAVILRHRPTGLTAEASERRSQAENRAVALRRLRLRLAVATRAAALPDDATPRSGPAAPSRLWQSRARGGRIAVADSHDDFPSLLAEALDALAAADWDARAAAGGLGVTPTQLVRLVAREPTALAELNRQRATRGLAALR
ncbi:MAG: peptide chain release factor family protein [Planctomycetota bacterium]|nr:peptide chain release factor-like protein [Planctomycetota bacterium]MBM4056869.1 peptide chain release factor-like protein [Planctomycetota bacterium]